MRRYLTLLSLLCLLIVFPSAATGADAVSFSSTAVPVIKDPRHGYVELAALVITMDPLTEGEHSALIALPRGYSLSVPATIQSVEDPHFRLDAFLTGQQNECKILIDYEGDSTKRTFVIPIKAIIPSGETGDIQLSITNIIGQLINGKVIVGRIAGGNLTVTSDPAQVRVIRPETEVPFLIKIAEDQGDVLRAGPETMRLILPEGFSWQQNSINIDILEDGGYLPGARVDTADLRILFVDIKDQDLRKKSSFNLSGMIMAEKTLLPGASVSVEVTGKDLERSFNFILTRVVKPETEARFIVGNEVYFSNGKALTMDVLPYIKEGRLFLPLRYVGLSLGVEPDNIIWNGQMATLTLGDKTVQVRPGAKQMLVNGKTKAMDIAAEVQFPGRVMLPYRFIAEAFGAIVEWDSNTRTVTMELLSS